MARADILAVVADQFYDVRKKLDIQLERSAQIQAQLDAQHAETNDLRLQVDTIHHMLNQIAAKS